MRVYEKSSSVVAGLTLVEALDARRNEVWRARRADGTEVAVKLLHPAYEPILPRRFGRISRILSSVVDRNPGWVDLIDHGYTTDGRRYVVMPLHRAGSLDGQLQIGPMPWHPATQMIAQVASSMASLHDAGWAFGHLRPTNILIDEDSHALVSLYGASTRAFDDGTPQYTAPELLRGEAAEPPADVFSLALILSSVIAGRPLDRLAAPEEIVASLVDTPPRIVEIIDYGLSTSLRNRYADAGKMATALHAALAAEPRVDSKDDRSGWQAVSRVEEDPIDDPLAAFLAGPIVGGDNGSDDGLGAGGIEAEEATIDSRDTDPGFEDDGWDEAITSPPLDESGSDATITLDDVTDPFAPIQRLDDPTDLPFGAGVRSEAVPTRPSDRAPTPTGPLSDLIDGQADGYDPDPTLDRSAAVKARLEIEKMIRGLQVRAEADAEGHADLGPAPAGPDTESEADSDGPEDGDGEPGDAPEPPESSPAGNEPESSSANGSIAANGHRPGRRAADGPEAAHEARRMADDVPFVAVSGDTRPAAPGLSGWGRRLAVLADLASSYRRQAASSFALIGVSLSVALAAIVMVGEFQPGSTVTGGPAVQPTPTTAAPGSSTVDHGSPLNDQSPIENARSVEYDGPAPQDRSPSPAGTRSRETSPAPTTTKQPVTTAAQADGGKESRRSTSSAAKATLDEAASSPTTAVVPTPTDPATAPTTTTKSRRTTTSGDGGTPEATTGPSTTRQATSSTTRPPSTSSAPSTTASPTTTAAPSTTAEPTETTRKPRGRDKATRP